MPSSGSRIYRVAVFVSGTGSNLEALLQAESEGGLTKAHIGLVIASKAGVGALERARIHHVPSAVIERKTFPDDAAWERAYLRKLESSRIDIICLAGFLKKIGPAVLAKYSGRILNIHPALLPKFGGPGMYGHFVHEAVVKAKEIASGCTVHLVDEEFDHGTILAQARVPVLPGDTGVTLAARVLEQEHRLYPQVLQQFCEQLDSKA